jgi:hypothetical protein
MQWSRRERSPRGTPKYASKNIKVAFILLHSIQEPRCFLQFIPRCFLGISELFYIKPILSSWGYRHKHRWETNKKMLWGHCIWRPSTYYSAFGTCPLYLLCEQRVYPCKSFSKSSGGPLPAYLIGTLPTAAVAQAQALHWGKWSQWLNGEEEFLDNLNFLLWGHNHTQYHAHVFWSLESRLHSWL